MGNEIEKHRVIIGIITPYLTEQLSAGTEEYRKQRELYAYDPKNLSGLVGFGIDGKLVELRAPRYYDEGCRENFKPKEPMHLIIAGSTEPGEDEVLSMRGSGLIVARYSIFYGGPSGYSGRYPEQGGYSLDLPKNVRAVLELITDTDFLDAIVEREAEKIRTSIEQVNKRIERPILVTPYLEKSLESKRLLGEHPIILN